MAFLEHIDFWHWWILAGILLIIELSVPTFYFLWLGMAAGLVGLMLLVIPGMSVELQMVMFVILSLVTTVMWRQYREKNQPESDRPLLNKRAQQHIGRTFTLIQPIENGIGKVRVADSSWRVRGPDLPAGSKVRVTGVDGVILLVEAAD